VLPFRFAIIATFLTPSLLNTSTRDSSSTRIPDGEQSNDASTWVALGSGPAIPSFPPDKEEDEYDDADVGRSVPVGAEIGANEGVDAEAAAMLADEPAPPNDDDDCTEILG